MFNILVEKIIIKNFSTLLHQFFTFLCTLYVRLHYAHCPVCRGVNHWIHFFQHKEISVCHFVAKYIFIIMFKNVLKISIYSHNTKLILLHGFREINVLQIKE